MTFEGIQNYRGECWKIINFPEQHNILASEIIYISNYGRLVRFKDEKHQVFKPYNLNGYPHLKVKTTKKVLYRGFNKTKHKGYYLHKLVAQHFLEQGDGMFVIHLDYNKQNNEARNLKWATKREKELHQWKNPVLLKRKRNKKDHLPSLPKIMYVLLKKC